MKYWSQIKPLVACLLCLYSGYALAQSTSACTRALEQAEAAFDQGRLLYILDKQESNGKTKTFYTCFEGGSFSIDEQIRATKLLVKVHLFADNETEAEQMLVRLLTIDKEHQLTNEDPAELHFLYSKFQTEPKYRLSFKASLNHVRPTILQSHNTNVEKDYYSGDVGLLINLGGEVAIEKHIQKGIEVGAGVQYREATYGVEGKMFGNNDIQYTIKNKSKMLRAPFYVRYNHNYAALDEDGKRIPFIPYVFVGGAPELTLSAEYIDGNRTGGTAFALQTNTSLTDLDQVTRQNFAIFGGIGAKIRWGREKVHFVTFELRYDNTIFPYINPDNRYANVDARGGIKHVEDDLTLNVISFTLGYTRSFYSLKKRKAYR